jgi:hypothetical protein
MTDPALHPDDGKIQDRTQTVSLGRKPLNTEVPFSLMFVSSDLNFAFLPPTGFRPTSVQLLFRLGDTATTVELIDLQLFALELKKSS